MRDLGYDNRYFCSPPDNPPAEKDGNTTAAISLILRLGFHHARHFRGTGRLNLLIGPAGSG